MTEGNFEERRASDVRNIGNTWAEFIQSMRQLAGNSQVRFAEDFGVTQQTVSRWESGHAPLRRQRQRLAAFFVLTREEQLLLNDGEIIEAFEPVPEVQGTELLLAAYATRIERGEPPLTEIDLQLILGMLSTNAMSGGSELAED